MFKDYNFQPTLPEEFKSFSESLRRDIDQPSLYAVSQIHIFESPVTVSIISYNHAPNNYYKNLKLLESEYTMMRLDLRCIWSGIHFRAYPDSVCWWLNTHGHKIADKLYESFLVTDLGIYYLHFDMEHGEVTFRVYIRSKVELAPAKEPVITLTLEEAAFVADALDMMYHTLAKNNSGDNQQRMAKAADLGKWISETRKMHQGADHPSIHK